MVFRLGIYLLHRTLVSDLPCRCDLFAAVTSRGPSPNLQNQLSINTPPSSPRLRRIEKVAAVSSSISDVLRLHATSLPEELAGHIVLVGGNKCLQYYILALRRLRPFKPIVVVTEDSVRPPFRGFSAGEGYWECSLEYLLSG